MLIPGTLNTTDLTPSQITTVRRLNDRKRAWMRACERASRLPGGDSWSRSFWAGRANDRLHRVLCRRFGAGEVILFDMDVL